VDPVLQLPGITQNSLDPLTRELDGPDCAGNLLWNLRCFPRGKAASALKKLPKGKLSLPIRSILDALYSIPKITIKNAQVTHKVDKTSGKGRGTLKLGIEVDRDGKQVKNSDNFATLSLVLGSFERRLLLGFTEVSISREGKRYIDKEIDFDWESANADGGEGGGFIILRMFLDRFRGMDSELAIGLR
jgi:hypothetical protein